MEDTLRSGLLSVVLPSYNEEASIPRAADTITAILIDADIPHELVFGTAPGPSFRNRRAAIPRSVGSASPGISAKRPPSSPVWPRPVETAL